MPARHARTKTSKNVNNPSVVPQNAFFPYARYISVVGVHTSLVAFTALFLPQTSRFLSQPKPRSTDAERPQSEFLDALTDSPVITLGWIVAGLLVLQPWWAGWIRQWCFDYTSRGTTDQIKLEKQRFQQNRFSVCSSLLTSTYLGAQILIFSQQKLGRAAVFTSCVAVVFHVAIVLFGAPFAR
jgi:phosphatidylinositol glycan class F